MKAPSRVAQALLLWCALFPPAAASAQGASLYLKDGRKLSLFAAESAEVPVARVGREAVALRELGEGLASAHEGRAAAAARKTDVQTVLDRVIDARLVVLEARAMGIDSLPEVQAQLKAFRDSTLRDVLKEKLVEKAGADPRELERAYRDAVREFRVRSVTFEKEADAERFAAEVKAGGSFEELARKVLAARQARGSADPEPLPEKKMLPEVLAAVRLLAPGSTSPPVKLSTSGHVVLQLVGESYPDDPKERAAIADAVRNRRHSELLRSHYARLRKRWVRVEQKLLGRLDLEAPRPGFEALLQDRRALARIEGEAPVTVADLCREIRKTFFHGADRAAQKRQLNNRKADALDKILASRLFLKDARARRLQESPAYRFQVEDFERSLLFGAGIERAVAPGVQVSEADERAYFEAHRAEFTWPRFVRLEGIAFGDARAAEAAVKKLRAGTDFKWFAANADGRLPADSTALKLEGSVVAATELGPDLSRSLAGARTGDYRLHTQGDEHYVVHVVEDIPPRQQPFEQVREDVKKKVFAEKLNQAVQEWTAQLRKSYPVEVLVARVGE